MDNDQMCGIPTGGREECDWDCGDPSNLFSVSCIF